MSTTDEHRTTHRDVADEPPVDLSPGGPPGRPGSSVAGLWRHRLSSLAATLGGLSAVRVVRRAVGPVWRAVTPLGRSVVVGSVGSTVLAAWLGWAEFAVFAVVGALALAIGVVMLLLANNHLEVLLSLKVRRVVAGEFAATDVETINTASRRMLPVHLEARVGAALARVEVPSLSSGEHHEEQITIGTERRAVVPVGPVRSVQGDPLGLVRREVLWTGVEELFVHPRTVRIGPLINGLRRDLEGESTNHRSPSDVAFHTLREYAVGDDRRHIHWRTTARQTDGTLMVREFVDTRRSEVAIVVGLRWQDWANDESFELGVSAAASIALRANADGLEFTCLAGQRVVPSHDVNSLLDGLSRIERGDDAGDVGSVVRRHRELLASTSIAVLVLGSATDLADARRAATVIGPQTHTIALVADVGRLSGRRPARGLNLCDLGALEDLGRVVAAVGA